MPVSHPPSTSSPFSIRSLLPPPIADLPANLHFFINCYVKAVCASAVAFDGPGNPCRQQIPQMTFSNKALMDDGSDLRTIQQSPPVREKRGPGYGQKIQSVASILNRRFPYRRIVRAQSLAHIAVVIQWYVPCYKLIAGLYSRNLRTHRSYLR